MVKKKIRFNFDDDFFDNFFNMDKFEDLFNDMLTDFEEMDRRKKPLVMGFSVKLDKEGNPIIEKFGDVKSGIQEPGFTDAREPLVDINKTDTEIIITAEMPGVEKKDLDLKVDNNNVTISVSGDKKFFKKIPLTESVDKESVKAKLNNGILEIVLKRSDNGKTIKIE